MTIPYHKDIWSRLIYPLTSLSHTSSRWRPWHAMHWCLPGNFGNLRIDRNSTESPLGRFCLSKKIITKISYPAEKTVIFSFAVYQLGLAPSERNAWTINGHICGFLMFFELKKPVHSNQKRISTSKIHLTIWFTWQVTSRGLHKTWQQFFFAVENNTHFICGLWGEQTNSNSYMLEVRSFHHLWLEKKGDFSVLVVVPLPLGHAKTTSSQWKSIKKKGSLHKHVSINYPLWTRVLGNIANVSKTWWISSQLWLTQPFGTIKIKVWQLDFSY